MGEFKFMISRHQDDRNFYSCLCLFSSCTDLSSEAHGYRALSVDDSLRMTIYQLLYKNKIGKNIRKKNGRHGNEVACSFALFMAPVFWFLRAPPVKGGFSPIGCGV